MTRFRDRFRAAGGALPDYVAAARIFFGDDDAIDAYLTTLEGYAIDGVEATDLLNAAIAAGDVTAAIALLGGAAPTTYTDLAAVMTAGLSEGAQWRIAWGAGTLAAPFASAGEVVGDIRNGDPSWIGFLPYEKWGTTLSDVTATGGTRTTDSDGRPRLSVTSTSGSSVETDLGMRADRPQRVRLLARLTAAAPADSGSEFGGLRLKRVAGGNSLTGYVGRFTSIGGWYGGAAGASTIAFPNLDSPTDTSKFNPGKNIEFELQFITGNTGTNALLAGSTLPNGETRKLQSSTNSTHIGDGSAVNDIDLRAYLISRGAAMTLDLLGVQISGPPTRG